MKRENVLRVTLSVACLALAGCDPVRPDDRLCQLEQKLFSESELRSFAFGYLPQSVSTPVSSCYRPMIDRQLGEHFARGWKAACEPSFFQLSQSHLTPDFALRFSYFHSFSGSVFITVRSEGDSLKLVVKEMAGQGGYDLGVIGRSKEFLLSKQQASDLESLLSEQTLFEKPADVCLNQFDGGTAIFELIDEEGYRIEKDGDALRIGVHLRNLTGWGVD